MNDIFDILSSRAKALVLRTLFFQPGALPLRHIAYTSGMPVFSVQRAIEGLLVCNAISRRDEGNYALFELNRASPFYPVLAQFFTAETNRRITMESRALDKKASLALKFASSAAAFFRQAKKKRRAA